METTISITIPQGYWGIVKRWFSKVRKAPELLGYPQPTIEVQENGIIYTTASGCGQYILRACPQELSIEFVGRRNSFRSGTPFLGFRWHGAYENNGQVDVVLKDVNPFAPEIVFLGHVNSFNTSRPEAPFFRVPPEWIHVPQTS
jgi:hypothetical protein